MRNLKRALSLALASIMVLGLMVVGASATSYEDFTDKDEIKNTEAVNTMVSLGVISGKDNGSYDPTGSLTRAEACTLIARMLGGGKDPVLGSNIKSNFKDTQGHWAENYIAYCANLGIIAGVGDGNFKPDDTLTGSAAAKMVLCALGYKPEFEGIGGANWELATNTLATKVKLYDGLETLNPSATISRDDVAQLIYNGVQANEVEYRNLQGDYSGTLYAQPVNGTNNNSTMLYVRFGVQKVEGVVEANEVFGINGRSATVAGKTYLNTGDSLTGAYPISMENDLVGQRVVIYVKYNNALSPNAAESSVLGEPIVSAKTTVVETSARLKDADAVKSALKSSGLSMPSDGDTNGEIFDYDTNTANTTTTGVQPTAGVRQRFIDNTGDGVVDLIIQEKSALAKVTVYNEKTEKLTLSGIGSIDFVDIANEEDVALNDYVLVNKLDDTYYLTKATTVEGEVTAYNATTPATITIDGTKYTLSANTNKTVDLDGIASNGALTSTMVGDTYRLYLDAAGNIIFAESIDEALGNYAVITAVDADPTSGFSTAKVKLTMSDGTSGTYTVDLLASAKKWSAGTNVSGDSAKEEEMAKALNGLTNELVTYTLNEDNTVVLGKPDYINSTDYDETGSKTVDNGAATNKTVLYSSDSSYKIGSTNVVMDNNTVFFIKDANGINVVVGLKNLPSKGVTPKGGNANVIYEIKSSTNTTTKTNVATAVYLEVTGTYASSTNYLYVTSDPSIIKENGDSIYTYSVVYADGTTGTVKTTSSAKLAKNMAYAYTIDSKGYADIKTDGFTVNNVYVDEVGNNTVVLLDADNYDNSKGSYPLAADVKVWNVEDTDDVYTTSLGKTSVASLVLNDDGEIKYAFVNEVRGDEMAGFVSTLSVTPSTAVNDDDNDMLDGTVGNLKDLAASDTITVKYTATASQKVTITVNGTKIEDAKAGTGSEATATKTYTTTASDSTITVVVTVSEQDKVSRSSTYVLKGAYKITDQTTANLTFGTTAEKATGAADITEDTTYVVVGDTVYVATSAANKKLSSDDVTLTVVTAPSSGEKAVYSFTMPAGGLEADAITEEAAGL